MKRLFLLIVVGTIFLGSCSTVPLTGRKQLILYPDAEINQMSAASYGEFLASNKLSTDKAATEQVKRIGYNIANAVEDYLNSQGFGAQLADFNWEFNLVESPEVNAWCMPGGKVVFYEGILPVCQNDDGIAVVMAHEIAHAIAKHSNERMSQQMLLSTGSQVALLAVDDKPDLTKQAVATAVGLGSTYGVVLPFSRKHEYEADRLGLIFMTMAGYEPEEAVRFWSRMSSNNQQKPIEFFSTHPADNNRVEALKALLPEVEKYRPNK